MYFVCILFSYSFKFSQEEETTIINVSKLIEYTTLGVSSHANYRLWVTTMCQGRFIYCNKCTTLERNVNKGRSYRCRVAAVKLLQSCPTLCNPMDVAHQVPLSVESPRQEYWSGLPFPSPGDLPDPGIKLRSLMSPALAGGFFITRATWEVYCMIKTVWFSLKCIRMYLY